MGHQVVFWREGERNREMETLSHRKFGNKALGWICALKKQSQHQSPASLNITFPGLSILTERGAESLGGFLDELITKARKFWHIVRCVKGEIVPL